MKTLFLLMIALSLAACCEGARAGGVTTYASFPPIVAEIRASQTFVAPGGTVTLKASDGGIGWAYDKDSYYVDGSFASYVSDTLTTSWSVKDANGQAAGSLSASSGLSVTWTAPVTAGTYTVTLSVQDGHIYGASADDVDFVGGLVRVKSITVGVPSSGSLDCSNNWASGSLDTSDPYSTVRDADGVPGCYSDTYTFTVPSGTSQSIELTLSSAEFDSYLILKSSSGTVLARDDDGAGPEVSQMVRTLNAGTYTIEVTTFAPNGTGQYLLTSMCVTDPSGSTNQGTLDRLELKQASTSLSGYTELQGSAVIAQVTEYDLCATPTTSWLSGTGGTVSLQSNSSYVTIAPPTGSFGTGNPNPVVVNVQGTGAGQGEGRAFFRVRAYQGTSYTATITATHTYTLHSYIFDPDAGPDENGDGEPDGVCVGSTNDVTVTRQITLTMSPNTLGIQEASLETAEPEDMELQSKLMRVTWPTSLAKTPASLKRNEIIIKKVDSGFAQYGPLIPNPTDDTYRFGYGAPHVYEMLAETGEDTFGNPTSYTVGLVKVLLFKVEAAENQAVDSRTDPRWSTLHFIDYQFGANAYRGGLFVGHANDPSRLGRSFLKFTLPTGQPGGGKWAAGSANAYVTRTLAEGAGSTMDVVAVPITNDAWSSATLQWESAWATVNPIGTTFNPSTATNAFPVDMTTVLPVTPGWARWRLGSGFTTAVQDASPGIVSVVLAAKKDDYTLLALSAKPSNVSGWIYFAKKEYRDGNNKAFVPFLLAAYTY